MKRPVFSQYERYHPFIGLSIAKLRFKREFEKSNLGLFLKGVVEWLNKILTKKS